MAPPPPQTCPKLLTYRLLLRPGLPCPTASQSLAIFQVWRKCHLSHEGVGTSSLQLPSAPGPWLSQLGPQDLPSSGHGGPVPLTALSTLHPRPAQVAGAGGAHAKASPSPCCFPAAQPTSTSPLSRAPTNRLVLARPSDNVQFGSLFFLFLLLPALSGYRPWWALSLGHTANHPSRLFFWLRSSWCRVDQPGYRPTHPPFLPRQPHVGRSLKRAWVPSSDGPCVSGPSAAPHGARQLEGLGHI